MKRRLLRLAGASFRLAAAALLAVAGRADAHGALKHSLPANGARLTEAPSALRLTFNEAPVIGFTRITLTGPAGAVALSALRVDSRLTVVSDIVGPLTPGSYTVDWQIAGRDGHPVRGKFFFTILDNARGLAAVPFTDTTGGSAPVAREPVRGPVTTSATPAELGAGRFDSASPAYVFIRWLTYLGLLGVIGAVAFRFAVLPRYRQLGPAEVEDAIALDAARRAARWGFLALVLLTLAAALRIVAQSFAVYGQSTASHVVDIVVETGWGRAWLVQITLSLSGAFALFRARRNPVGGRWWTVAACVAVLLAFTPGFGGHAMASSLPAAAVIANGLHILGAGGWIGSLAILLLAGFPAAWAEAGDSRMRAIGHMVNAFSPTALGFAALAALSGLFAAWLHLGSIAELWQSDYGQALMRKLAVLSIVAGTGAYNWRRLRPRLGTVEGVIAIRRTAAVEVVVGLIVLLLTAVLVAMPTPRV